LCPHELVAYLFEPAGARRLFVFRTLDRADLPGARVPGVWPRVRLLASFKSSGRIDRIERLFAHLARHACPATRLSDAFWLRVSLLMGGQLPRQKVLLSLLTEEKRLAC